MSELSDFANKPVCMQCGETKINTFYCNNPRPLRACYHDHKVKGAHMHRICKTCKYEWFEKTYEQTIKAQRAKQEAAEKQAMKARKKNTRGK